LGWLMKRSLKEPLEANRVKSIAGDASQRHVRGVGYMMSPLLGFSPVC
jgi:hypothetical protein